MLHPAPPRAAQPRAAPRQCPRRTSAPSPSCAAALSRQRGVLMLRQQLLLRTARWSFGLQDERGAAELSCKGRQRRAAGCNTTPACPSLPPTARGGQHNEIPFQAVKLQVLHTRTFGVGPLLLLPLLLITLVIVIRGCQPHVPEPAPLCDKDGVSQQSRDASRFVLPGCGAANVGRAPFQSAGERAAVGGGTGSRPG